MYEMRRIIDSRVHVKPRGMEMTSTCGTVGEEAAVFTIFDC